MWNMTVHPEDDFLHHALQDRVLLLYRKRAGPQLGQRGAALWRPREEQLGIHGYSPNRCIITLD